jgi:hypothetical protein
MRKTVLAVASLATMALAVTLAPAITVLGHAGVGGTDKVHACVNPNTKVLTLAKTRASAKCPTGQKAVHWAKQGPKGDPGDKGEPGGPDGDKGPVGDQGPVGDKGPDGDKGPVGDQGPVGDKGPDGDKGPVGDQGPDGDQGPVGDKGPDGDKGPVGDQGPVGDKGPDGDAGIVPIYNAAGTLQTSMEIVTGTVTLVSGTATVNLLGSASFTGNTTYVCTVTTQTAASDLNPDSSADTFRVNRISGSQFTVRSASSSSTRTVGYVCLGN